MKRFEEAELEVVCFRNAVIATSGCDSCDEGCGYDCGSDNCSCWGDGEGE